MRNNQQRLDDLRAGLKAMFGELGGCLDKAVESGQPIFIERAADLRADHAYVLCELSDKSAAAAVSDRFVDGIIAYWAQLPALIYAPEMLESEDPEILNDVDRILLEAERKLQVFYDAAIPKPVDPNAKGLFAGLQKHSGMMTRVSIAQDILEAGTNMARQNIFPYA